jgi:hypothetical protein
MANSKSYCSVVWSATSCYNQTLLNVFESQELVENAVSSILEHTAEDGKVYDTKFYNLDAIISVGYRVNSTKATQFRIWATKALKEYIIKGFVLDDNRLKQGRFNPNRVSNPVRVKI